MRILLEVSTLGFKTYHFLAKRISEIYPGSQFGIIRGPKVALDFLQSQDDRTAEDEYNLGLAFEANGEIPLARKHYQLALKQDNEKQEFKDALRRTQN